MCAATFQVNAGCGRTAMMSIGNVECGDFRELGFDQPDTFSVANGPRAVAHAVLAGEIHIRWRGEALCHELVQVCCRPVGQEHRAGLGIESLHVTDTVVLLVRACELVPFDDSIQIFLAAGRGHESGLAVAAHDLAIEIETGLGLLPQGAFRDQPVKVLPPLGVDFRRVRVGSRRQIDLRLADVQKAQRVALRHLAGFRGGHDVVGQFADAVCQVGFGAQCRERFDGCHRTGGER